MITPRQPDVDTFFTEQNHQKSFPDKSDADEWEETRRWVDNLHQLNSSFTLQQQNQGVGPMGMSRDSLNGTITGANLLQSNDNRREPPLPTLESDHTRQTIPAEIDPRRENASITIQRWYRQNNERLQPKKSASFKQKEPLEDEQNQTRIVSLKVWVVVIRLNL